MLIATLCNQTRVARSGPHAPGSVQTVRIPVRAGRYYEARAEAFELALAYGHSLVMIRTHGTRVCSVHQGLKGSLAVYPDDPAFLNMVLDCARLLNHGHDAVLVAPRTAVDQLPEVYTLNHPVIPMVAAYRVLSAMSVSYDTPSLGINMVQAGASVITSKRYCFTHKTPVLLDEFGSASTWKEAYDARRVTTH